MRRRDLIAWLLVLACALAGCTYDRREPGLFGQSRDEPSTAATSEPPPPRTANGNPQLPVLAEAVWTSGEGLYLNVRVAVHAVRRITGGTVLDWSVTPLLSSGLAPGERPPGQLDLGLTRPDDGRLEIFLLDHSGGRVYRPLSEVRRGREACLCTPLGRAQAEVRIGQTRLLQVAFPPLPYGLVAVDVDIATVPPFYHVPVTPIGLVPSVTSPVDLTRPADLTAAVANTVDFRYGPAKQRFFIAIEAVYVSSTFTAVWWTIQSSSPGPGLDAADQPPIADAHPPPHPGNAVSAGGPQILGARGAPLRVRLATSRAAGTGIQECLCTGLRGWAGSLREPSERVSVATILPPLPIGTLQVDVVLPGLPPMTGVRATAASDSAFRSAGPVEHSTKTWSNRPDSAEPGWAPSEWPTPVPAPADIKAFRQVVDSLVR
jgi:hypothetical protein